MNHISNEKNVVLHESNWYWYGTNQVSNRSNEVSKYNNQVLPETKSSCNDGEHRQQEFQYIDRMSGWPLGQSHSVYMNQVFSREYMSFFTHPVIYKTIQSLWLSCLSHLVSLDLVSSMQSSFIHWRRLSICFALWLVVLITPVTSP
jgi:hypothetical protein